MGTLFVGNVDHQCSEMALLEIFKRYGTVSRFVLCTDPSSGKRRGFGFVSYLHDTDSENALRATRDLRFGDRNLIVAPRTSRRPPVEKKGEDKPLTNYSAKP